MFKSVAFEVVGDQRLVCAGCEQRVEHTLKTLEGIGQVRAQARDQRIEVLFDAGKLDTTTIAERIGKAGYQTRVVSSTSDSSSTPQTGTVDTSSVRTTVRKWTSAVASVLSSVLALKCPICIPAVASFLASIGVAAATAETILQPLLILLLLVSVASLAWAARLHRRWWILLPGIVGAVLIYAGHHIWYSLPLMWLGAVTLIGTSIANFTIKRACCRCEQSTPTELAVGER